MEDLSFIGELNAFIPRLRKLISGAAFVIMVSTGKLREKLLKIRKIKYHNSIEKREKEITTMMNKLMKKIALALTVATMTLTSAASVSAAYGKGIESSPTAHVVEKDYSVTVGQYGANIRAAATTDSNILYYLEPGTEVQISGLIYNNGKASDWYVVQITNGKRGYINEVTFDYMAGAAATSKTAEATLKEYMDTNFEKDAKFTAHDVNSNKTVYVESGYLALRSYPSYEYSNEIEPLYNGETVEILGGTSGSYVYVCAESGNYGWVNAGFLY